MLLKVLESLEKKSNIPHSQIRLQNILTARESLGSSHMKKIYSNAMLSPEEDEPHWVSNPENRTLSWHSLLKNSYLLEREKKKSCNYPTPDFWNPAHLSYFSFLLWEHNECCSQRTNGLFSPTLFPFLPHETWSRGLERLQEPLHRLQGDSSARD